MDQAAPSIETVTVTAAKSAPSHLWGGNGFSFHDLLDAINPLQHIPVVSTIYRRITGDRPGNVAEIVGDGLFGGVIGLAAGAVNVALREATGKDVGETITAWVTGDDKKPDEKPPEPPPQPAQAAPQVALAKLPPADPPPDPKPSAAPRPALNPLDSGRRFIPIDVSQRGIQAIRAASSAHQSVPVPLDLPPGAVLSSPVTPVDYAQKMREGLDKYDAMLAQRTGGLAGGSVDQIH
jgi:hypothetical protein